MVTMQWIAVEAIKPNARNARTHSKKQIRQIADSTTAFGFLVPILIDQGGLIIAGHGRYAAAVLLGLQQVPVIQVEGLSEAKRRALALADPTKNHPGELHDSELEIIRIGSARTRAACRQGAKLESGDKMAATHLNKNAASKRLLLANDLYHLLPDKAVSKYVRVH